MRILITGAAGFIGYTLSQRLLARGESVLGIDNLNDYYDVGLKQARLGRLTGEARFRFEKIDIADQPAMSALFARESFDVIVHLAAQVGVRYSIVNPHAYISANLVGYANVIEGARRGKVKHFVFASSSSVYGANTRLPSAESDNVDHPVSLYAATKKANELMAHSYAHLYGLPCTGLRFFTVYGPWGRPDMALFLFTRAILRDEPIQVFNRGRMVRDFTYIDDVVEGVVRVIDRPATPDPAWQGRDPNPATSLAPYRIFNIGNGQPVELVRYIHAIEAALGRKAVMNMLPMQAGDVAETAADISRLEAAIDFRPRTGVEEGVKKFVAWYKDYYRVAG
jgi:UDP-glucuronate 4-epimerase